MPSTALGKIINVVKAFRGILVAIVLLVIGIPVASYIVMSSQWAQTQLRAVGEEQLSALLGSDVHIGYVRFYPFNRLVLDDVTVTDDFGQTALSVAELDTRFEMWDLIKYRKIIVDYAEVRGLDLHLYRDSVHSPLNIERIINHLKSDEKSDSAAVFDLRVNDVRLIDCAFSYDVISAPEDSSKFNPHHIRLSDIELNVFAPVISNDAYSVWVRSLSFREHSGFRLSDLTFQALLTQSSIAISALSCELPNSRIDFEDIDTPIRDLANIASLDPKMRLDIRLKEGSHIYLPDVKAFVPVFANLDYDFDIETEIYATTKAVDISNLKLSESNGIFDVTLSALVSGYTSLDSMRIEDVDFGAAANSVAISHFIDYYPSPLPERTVALLSSIGNLRVAGSASGTSRDVDFDVRVRSHLASANIEGDVRNPFGGGGLGFNINAEVDSAKLNLFVPGNGLGNFSGSLNASGVMHGKDLEVKAILNANNVDYKAYRYNNIDANLDYSSDSIAVTLSVDDPCAKLFANLDYYIEHGLHSLDATLELDNVRLDSLNLVEKYGGYRLSGVAEVTARGTSVDSFNADLAVRDIAFIKDKNNGLRIKKFDVLANNTTPNGRIVVSSDFVNGSVDGCIRPSTFVADIKGIIACILPDIIPQNSDSHVALQQSAGDTGLSDMKVASPSDTIAANAFAFDFTLTHTDRLSEFFGIPVSVIDNATFFGNLDSSAKELFMKLDMPWLQQGGAIIENTSVVADLHGSQNTGSVYLSSMIPTKKGNMDVLASVKGIDGRLDTNIDWSLERAIPINGVIDFTMLFDRDDAGTLFTRVDFNPGEINFGNEIWSILPSTILYRDNLLSVSNFALDSGLQSINIDGVAGISEFDDLYVDLKNIELINIFETLGIDKALIGGQATGIITASALFSKNPSITCDCLAVRSIGYNYCTLGDAMVKLSLDDGGKTFNFSADVVNPQGNPSTIKGYIELPTESLYLDINADKINVGFMKPFMEAFTSDVEGLASGKACLYGTFKEIDLIGDIYASDLRIKIDFTNTWYSASDSIHIRPGRILLDNITLSDEYNHTATLNGWVSHHFFHNAAFDFKITDADRFLCYDVPKSLSPDWYGRIFGRGEAAIKGAPGYVDIYAKMTTQSVPVKGNTLTSIFTFELSDRLDAEEFSFLNFRDCTPLPVHQDSILHADIVPEKVKEVRGNQNSQADESPTSYRMNINIVATPEAEFIIVMDPVGRDQITCHGSGDMTMTYESISNDLQLHGRYTLDRGFYNFTLQDVIVKPFTISSGSWIKFTGDPYNATVDMKVYFQTKANLADLDESFLQDKDVSRSGVNVRAVVFVTGLLLQPTIKFDIELPDLAEEINRKLHSIVSTEDMMSRQMIYLLALGRFYTPEYMASANKGNELFSVASATLSSQISSMLGKLSDNWSIAPNVRSDKGDFSDIEVDLTLSSSLLNNRLLFNGNFGYRDKSLNTNQFVGDFDLEYLLNESGVWRLKAYNRYNDQNYYLRTAQTTQGVGILYRKDFDRTLRFLRHIFRKNKDDNNAPPSDSINVSGIIHVSDSDIIMQDTISVQ